LACRDKWVLEYSPYSCYMNFNLLRSNIATIRKVEQEHFQRVGYLIAFGGGSLIWATLLMLILL
jgi:hypothetical protein